jgi:hypothetical protein
MRGRFFLDCNSVLALLLDFQHHESVIEQMIGLDLMEVNAMLYSTALARAHDLGYPIYDTAITTLKHRRSMWFYESGGKIKSWLYSQRCRQVHSLLWLTALVVRKHALASYEALPVPVELIAVIKSV